LSAARRKSAPIAIADLAARVGGAPFVSRWFTLDQARIDAFAAVTEDRQFIHVDPVGAKASPFGGTIAHGFLTLAMLAAMADDALPPVAGLALSVNYGFDRVRFVAPVKAGARVRGLFALADATQRAPREWLTRYETTIEIEGADKPALVARWLMMLAAAG
jgi:acyl dehydratase